jgi:hypothetical protein
MAKQSEIDDLDELIDRAVDTFFVEAPSLEERTPEEAPKQKSAGAVPQESAPRQRPPDPSFEEVMDQLFMDSPVGPSSSEQRTTTVISSGDPDIDRAIDLAVETLFVEEPETPPPETAQLQMPETNEADELFGQTPDIEAAARKRMEALEPELAEIHRGEATESEQQFSYDDAMAMAIARHMNSMYGEAEASRQAEPSQEAQPSVAMPAVRRQLSSQDALALRRLQEAILTLEWEISRRSVAVLASELQKVRGRFQDNIAVDFAAMSMRIVLEYVAKRMSRAHPESVRFLLEVTDFLERLLASGEEDPLRAFHQIVQRYETYKSVVRQAEGLPNRKPEIVGKLEIRDPEAFASLVDAYAVTLSRAGQSLAKRIKNSGDPENLIRSFRFLVTRSMNRVLEKTLKEGAKTRPDREKS